MASKFSWRVFARSIFKFVDENPAGGETSVICSSAMQRSWSIRDAIYLENISQKLTQKKTTAARQLEVCTSASSFRSWQLADMTYIRTSPILVVGSLRCQFFSIFMHKKRKYLRKRNIRRVSFPSLRKTWPRLMKILQYVNIAVLQFLKRF